MSIRERHETVLPGLRCGPMGAWLAAAGLLRTLSRSDPNAMLHWEGAVPVLSASSYAWDRDVADRSVFTPVITPWQAGGGWGPKDKTPAADLAALRHSTSPRLAAVREAIRGADAVMSRHGSEDKDSLVRRLRNTLPDEAIAWLDVVVPLRSAQDDAGALTVAWAPLAGTGGNDGRWDLSAQYMSSLISLDAGRGPDPDGSTRDRPVLRRRAWLADLAGGEENEPLVTGSSGPYWPEATGSGFRNPWAVILTAEGLCAFGDALKRVQDTRSQPWTTARLGADIGSDTGWGEAWLPLWGQPMTIAEVRAVLGGPLPSWRGSPAVTPAAMYASFRTLGWPRGITGFARYGLVRRHGRSHVAAPLDIITPAPGAGLAEVRMLDAAEAAGRAGVGTRTWTGYVARGQAPPPDWRDMRTGRPQWAEPTVDAWLALRPGKGARTDLGGSR